MMPNYAQVLRESALGMVCKECGAGPNVLCMTVKGFVIKNPHQRRIDDYIKSRLTGGPL